mgnify:FL=1
MIIPKQTSGVARRRSARPSRSALLPQDCTVRKIVRCAPLLVECERACWSGDEEACAECVDRLGDCDECWFDDSLEAGDDVDFDGYSAMDYPLDGDSEADAEPAETDYP